MPPADYTSLFVAKSDDGEVTVKCKKNKDATECAEAHAFAFKTVQVPAEMMPRATRTDQREGGVLIAIEPSHAADHGTEAHAWRELERQVRDHPGTLNTGGAETLLREHGVSQARARKLVAHGTREGSELVVQKGTGRRNRGSYLYPGADPLSSIENRLIDHPAAVEARAEADEIEHAADLRAAATAHTHQRRAEADRAEIDSAAEILRELDPLPTLTAAKRSVRDRSGGALKVKNIEAAYERIVRERDSTAVA